MLVKADRSVLLLIDLQSKLAPAIHQADRCLAQCRLLLAAARRLEIPVLASEQYPAGIGKTVAALRDRLDPGEIIEKVHFDGSAEPVLYQALLALDRPTIIIGGMEAHVCVLQTALGLKAKGLEPVIVADATSSRLPEARDLAISRMRHHRIDIVNTEMVLFEWLRVADTPAFRDLLPMIKSGEADDELA